LAGKTPAGWGTGTETVTPTHDWRVGATSDPAGTATDVTMGRAAVNNTYPLTITGAGTALVHKTHCGRWINLTGSGTFTVDVDALDPGFTCVIENNTSGSITFPTPTGTGAAVNGPLNGDTKIPVNGVVTVAVRGNTVIWRGDSTT
jgi:hypothetical protein